MTRMPTAPGLAAGTLIYEVLRLHGRLIAAGDGLMEDLGLTSARWQVLGTLAANRSRLTVSDLARILGQSRQSIQRLVNEMGRDGIVESLPNPDHKRSVFVVPTAEGRRLHALVEDRRIPWTEAIASGLEGFDTAEAARALSALRRLLERRQG
jgi:DNA-binding MarR family transcriptional regulator